MFIVSVSTLYLWTSCLDKVLQPRLWPFEWSLCHLVGILHSSGAQWWLCSSFRGWRTSFRTLLTWKYLLQSDWWPPLSFSCPQFSYSMHFIYQELLLGFHCIPFLFPFGSNITFSFIQITVIFVSSPHAVQSFPLSTAVAQYWTTSSKENITD